MQGMLAEEQAMQQTAVDRWGCRVAHVKYAHAMYAHAIYAHVTQ